MFGSLYLSQINILGSIYYNPGRSRCHCVAVDPWFIVARYPDTARIIDRPDGLTNENGVGCREN